MCVNVHINVILWETSLRSIESLRRSDVLIMMFAFPLVPWPFIGIAFYYHYERAWLGDMERDASQPLL